MAQQKSTRPIRRYTVKRNISRKQQAIYRRRRLVALAALLAALALVVFCVYSFGRGAVAIGEAINHNEIYAVSRDAVPDPPAVSGVPDCTGEDIELSLSAAAQSIAVGGSLDFTATITYTGSSKAGCLVDASDASRVLTITSGGDTVWRSDVCPSDSRMLLMSKGSDESRQDKQQITWNADRTGDTCVEDGDLPRVDRGTYEARLSLKDYPKVVSDPVTITVE